MINFFKKAKKEPQDLKEVLNILKKIEGDFEKVSKELADLKQANKKNLQKVGMVRFNPFRESGGDQSFSIAALDASHNGFVITSLFSNGANQVYAKPISNGVSVYSLSQEEKEAINKAINV
ncbi:MAG: DUF4446 family protein [Candidatus Nealsonbacteria bacterium]